jgi:hypothetical protein
VRLCHPPHSVHIVEQIISDFKAGKENKAAFWISSFKGRFIYIEYTALRGVDNEYLGVIEVKTKKGTGRGFQISYEGNVGFEQMYKHLEMLNAAEYVATAKALGIYCNNGGFREGKYVFFISD